VNDSGGVTPRVWSVSALVHAIGDTLQARFATVALRGEISGFTRAASGHAYFTLKDEREPASVRCAMFRRAFSLSTQGGFQPRDGQLVEAVGQVAVYEARGELQLVIERLQPAGAGAWYEQFLRLKARLEAEGLFDPQRKRALPRHPQRVAVITSLGAAALRDVLQVMRRRAPHVELVLVPCMVQGAEAPSQIVAALAQAQALHRGGQRIDTVILCRGGGSIEDLWAFNDERVVRAVSACTLPLVCGVGHETDVTLSDFAASVRAPTPSAAAEMVCSDRLDSLRVLQSLATQLHLRAHRALDAQGQRVDRAASRLGRPGRLVADEQQHLSAMAARMRHAVKQRASSQVQTLQHLQQRLQRAAPASWQRADVRLQSLSTALQALAPQRVLERGYAWLSTPEGQVVSGVAQVRNGQHLQAQLHDGHLQLQVEGVQAVQPTDST
jgi:exodeoxyribonuclease VII large subunit